MARIYSIRLYAGSIAANTSTTIAQVPDGYLWIARDVVAVPVGSATAGLFSLYTNDPGLPILMSIPTATSRVTYTWSGRQVLPQGTTLQVNSGPNSVRLLISGYQFLADN